MVMEHKVSGAGGSRQTGVYVGIGILFIIYMFIVLYFNPTGAILSLFSDDAFYYFKIAKNIHSGLGCTFDGITPTSGFHPLWMLYVLFIYAIAPGGLHAPLLLIMATQGLVGLATLVLLFRLVERYIAPGFGLVTIAAALLPNLLTAMINGLETGLTIFLIGLLVWYCYRERLLEPALGGRRAFLFGLFMGIVTLSRLDSVFLLASVLCLTIIGAIAYSLPAMRTIRRLFHVCAGFAIVVCPYMVWNRVTFGSFMPISGAVKSSFPEIRHPLAMNGDMLIGATMVAVSAALFVFIASMKKYRGGQLREEIKSPITMLTVASFLHFAHIYLFMSWGVYWWHFVLYGLTIAIALPCCLHLIAESRRGLRVFLHLAVIIPLIALAFAVKLNELKFKSKQHERWLQSAEWVRDNTDPNTVVAILDAGLFGYFSERKVVNLDGKANGYEYYRHMKRGDVEQYLKHVGVRYIANVRVDYDPGFCRIVIRRPNQSGIILKMMEEWEVYRSLPIPSHTPRFRRVPESYFVIWKAPWAEEIPSYQNDLPLRM
jgi:hypothetical protein